MSLVTASPRVSDRAKIEAQQIAGRAQTSSINGDNVAATTLYAQAAKLDPTDPSIAYALGREYEAVHDTRAMAEYCRFLALNPTAPEATDVRQRIGELTLALPPDTTVVRVPVAARTTMPAPGGALLAGLIVPGLGQFMTHHVTSGLLVMATTVGAIAYGAQSSNQAVMVTRTAVDPLGHAYQYTTTEQRTVHPHAVVGFGAAAAIAVIGAVDAFASARAGRNAAARASASATGSDARPPRFALPMLAFAPGSVGIGVSIR